MVLMYLTIGLFAFPHGPFIRPHPIVWRVFFALSLLYLLVLTGLLFASADQTRQILNYVDPTVGVPFELANYADNCDLTWANVYDKMDRFVVAHFLGWVVKGLMIRHRILLWLFSITWELIELSLIYAVPNFAECWWDSWVLDVLICNGLGIELGLYLCRYFEHKTYEWSGVLETGTLVQKIKRSALQFTPESWMLVEWESLATVKRYLQVQFLILMLLAVDLNAFLLKLHLYIPTNHSWNVYRLVMLMMVALPSIRQYYLYCADSRVNRFGSQVLVLLLIVIAELALSIKTIPPNSPKPPLKNVICWCLFLTGYVTCSVLLLLRHKRRHRRDVLNAPGSRIVKTTQVRHHGRSKNKKV